MNEMQRVHPLRAISEDRQTEVKQLNTYNETDRTFQ